MVIDIIIFIIIAYFYEYVNSSETATVHIDDTAGLVNNIEMEDSFKTKWKLFHFFFYFNLACWLIYYIPSLLFIFIPEHSSDKISIFS